MAEQKSVAVETVKKAKKRTIQYDRWGYFFIAPFFLVYIIFSLIPLATTFVYSFFEYYRDGLEIIGPNAKVSKYFSGKAEFYQWQIDDSIVALDDLVVKYESNTKVTLGLKTEICDTVFAIAEDIDSAKYEKNLAKIVDKAIKQKKTPVYVIEQAQALLNDTQPAVVANIKTVFNSNDNMWRYFTNTLIMWILGFVPQILISLLLAVWFTNTELRLKGQQFFKTVIYLPNLIMAAAFAMLFFSLFSVNGPINSIIVRLFDSMNAEAIAAGTIQPMERVRFFTSTGWTRVIVAIMNFLMWYGNTTILLMAGVMGIDNSLFEAARIDGANPIQIFFKVTIPLLVPIFVYVLITSLIGGIQMFDVPQIITNGSGAPNRTTMTIIMKLNKHLASKNYGPAGVTSILIFAVTGILSGISYKISMRNYQNKK